MTKKRFYVLDRKVSDLTRFSAINCRYWVIDRTTNLPVDEFTTKKPASMAASYYNKNGLYGYCTKQTGSSNGALLRADRTNSS